MNNEYLGRGMAFPSWQDGAGQARQSIRIGATGGFEETAGVRKIEESIRIILGTQYGERAMRPTFGCNLKSLLFAPNNEATANLARHYVTEGLARWEPRIEVLEVTIDRDLVDRQVGVMRISIHYRIKATQLTQSFVYPFYLEPRPA
jgi:phage baseplate assembly protein W